MLGVVPRWWRNRKRDHFLPRKFIKRSSASVATPTEQRLITGIGSQMHRKAEQSPQRIKMKRETKDFGDRNTLLERESWRRRSFYTMGNLTGEVSGDLRNLKRKHNWDNSPQKSHGMAITSWEAAYMSKPTWSKWGLDVEVWAASSVLRERNGVECREDTLRELMWLSIDRRGKLWTWQRNKGAFPWKGPNTTLWLLACSQNKGPCTSEYGRGMIQLPFMAPESERQVCAAGGRRQGVAAISAPETASGGKLWVDCQSLPMFSWYPGWLRSSRSVTAWDQLPWGDTRRTCNCALWSTQETEQLGPGRLEGAQPPSRPPHLAVATPMWSCHCKCSPHVPAAFAVFLPLHSTSEQVGPGTWLLLLPCVRAEVRHWRETCSQRWPTWAKIRRENCPINARCNRFKSCS